MSIPMTPTQHMRAIAVLGLPLILSHVAQFSISLTDALMLGNCHYGLLNARCTEPDAGEAAAGFFLSRFAYDEEELLLVAVLPGLRGLGIGESLLRRFAEQARARGAQRLLLEMRENNRAEHLYRRTGFTPIGRRPGYYSGPDGTRLDAITFELSLR